ncbi:Uncharacterised protein [Mycobacterium tuberculosis]|uniref:Uncharacterized protein n=1 Tax=Mycobacterium tuberculosis TaxID=1773 RepID=A0A655ASL1_MYCTX|nr:Uncharacterised protein [Mycobacterium tuberculosis]CKT61690.1 Uncharacterised protein [Mycobacterium tuberculosis]CKT85745.1 Uncharacterised protein [Mycobacterium tuberculosis]CKU05724.1 Uncharacterised protein [Mycobacterium tuberculosis]CPA49570.1 Uncharacterised protein [Mycobacterium tuberculosis]
MANTAVPMMALRKPPPLPWESCTSTLQWKTGTARLTTPINIHNVGVITTARQHTHAAHHRASTILRR